MSPVTQASAIENLDAEQDAGQGAGREAGHEADQEGVQKAVQDGGQDPDAGAAAVDGSLVADWLLENPQFFDEHADLLAEVRIRHPHGGRAISLVERQVLVLRERNKALELRMAELIRIGQENDGIGSRLQQLTRDLLRTSDAAQLPAVLLEGLQSGFGVPQVGIRLWGIEGLQPPFGNDVSAELRRRVDELTQPYCGPNSHPEAAGWLGGAESAQTASMAMLALRAPQPSGQPGGALSRTFGLLVLGSDDAARFQAGMGTSFLERIGEIAGASLSRLLA